MRLIKTKSSFRKEFKRQMRYAIAAAVGFLIIFAWRDAILNNTREIVEKFTETTQGMTSEFLTALAVTVIGVIIILISSKLLKER